MIKSVHGTLGGLSGRRRRDGGGSHKPAVPIKRSITPEYIICLEDGKKLKMLKRYLRSNYNLTPEEYRAKWGLPADYPMVAPNYAKQRSDFAKKIGLGRTALVGAASAAADRLQSRAAAFTRRSFVSARIQASSTAAASSAARGAVAGPCDRHFGAGRGIDGAHLCAARQCTTNFDEDFARGVRRAGIRRRA